MKGLEAVFWIVRTCNYDSLARHVEVHVDLLKYVELLHAYFPIYSIYGCLPLSEGLYKKLESEFIFNRRVEHHLKLFCEGMKPRDKASSQKELDLALGT